MSNGVLIQAQMLIDEEQYDRAYEMLEKAYEKLKDDAEYLEKIALLAKTMEKTEEIPSLSQIIDSIQTKEELEQFRKLVQTTLGANRASSKQDSDAKGSGGK